MATTYPPATPKPWERYGTPPSAGPRITPLTPPRSREPTPQTPEQAEMDRLRVQGEQQKQQSFDAGGGVDASVEQRKASGFYSRALKANQGYEAMGVGARSLPGQFAQENFPGIDNALFIDPQTQQAKVWQDDFIRATLRYESGAAIPPAEMDAQRRAYFPMPGDTPETLQAKAQSRKNAVEALNLGGGAASSLVPNETPLSVQQGRRAGPNEDVRFAGDQPAIPVGQRFTDAQTAEVRQALLDGDIGQAVALVGRYNGGKPVDRAGLMQASAALRKNPDAAFTMSYSAADQEARDQYERERYGDYLDPAISDRGKAGGGADSFVRQGANSATAGAADVLAAGGDALLGSGKGETLGERFRDRLRRERARTEADFRVNPVASWSGTIAGGLAIPTKVGPVSQAARTKALGDGVPYARAMAAGRRAGAGRAAMEGGVYGGVRGSLDNIESDRPYAYGLAGAATGASVGYGLQRVFSRLGSRGIPDDENAVPVARAAMDEGIPVGRPIVDPSRRNTMAYLEGSVGGGPIRRGLDQTSTALEGRVGSLGAGGTALDETAIGSTIQNAGRRFITESRGQAQRLYDRAARMAGNAAVRGENAVKALDDQIMDLSRNANSNAPLIRYLQEIRSDFVDSAGQLIAKDVGAIRDLRTSLRGQISNRNLTATDAERRIGEVLDAASTDIQRDMGSTVPGAVRAFERADQFYRERQSEINNVIQRVLGRSRRNEDQISPQKAWAAVRSMAGPNGDSQSLARLWNRLDPQEARDAAATLAENFGRRSAEEPFSPALFVQAIRGLSKPARETLFGPQGARSIENLRLVSEAVRDTMGKLNNSRSGQIQQYGQFFRNFLPQTLLGGGGGFVAGGPIGAAAGATLLGGAGLLFRNVSARMLMSPAYSRWLVRAGRADTPRKMMAAIEALTKAATRDPAVAQEMIGIQDDLRKAFDNLKEGYPVKVSVGGKP